MPNRLWQDPGRIRNTPGLPSAKQKGAPRRGAPSSLRLGGGYPPMAFSIEIDTPGPMVEHREIFFM